MDEKTKSSPAETFKDTYRDDTLRLLDVPNPFPMQTCPEPGKPLAEPIVVPATRGCFGSALQALREGKHVRRAGWNGKGMHLELVTNGCFGRPGDVPGNGTDLGPFIVMWTAQQNWVPWQPSQADMLAEDWELAPGSPTVWPAK